MGTKKIVLDTNIIISAFGWKGKPKEILDLIIDGTFELVLSVNQFLEIRNVLTYPRLRFTRKTQERILLLLNEVATIVNTKRTIHVIKTDPSDNVILEPAAEMNVDYIITGDTKHILPLREFNGAKIVTAAQFLKEI